MPGQLVHDKIFFFLILGIAFSIPVYGGLIPPLIMMLFLNWLAEGSYITTFPRLLRERPRRTVFALSVLFFLYLAGMTYTTNISNGLFDLEVKLSIFIFPLIFATNKTIAFSEDKIKKILAVFVLGCLAGTLILLGRAVIETIMFQTKNAFYYSPLSWTFHPGYMAMYLALCISILVFYLVRTIKSSGWLQKTTLIMLILYFSTFIFLLSSKGGLLGLLLTLLFYSLVLFFKYRDRRAGLIMAGSTFLMFFIGLNLFTFTADRIFQVKKDIVQKNTFQSTESSTADRKAAWKSSIDVLKKHWMFGVGTGDVKDVLLEQYRLNNYSFAFENKLNAHNQFLQTFMAIGVAGVLSLILLLLIPGLGSLRTSNFIYFLFLLVFSMNIFGESMFETQGGVVFFAFFNVILFTSRTTISRWAVEPVSWNI